MLKQKRHKRMMMFAVCAALLGLGSSIILSALQSNSQFYYNASDVAAPDFAPQSTPFRVGGLVVEGSIQSSGLRTDFEMQDFERPMQAPLKVDYTGVLPDLFREGQGAVISGDINPDGSLTADEVLAKHDEKYQPKIGYRDEINSSK